ncbi:hypothetical protein AsFPU1_4274 [Aphanothece sacrum FPU1]|uniref:Uncharacterized protein n=2 Tax=Aphanothece sacrum TaxID=1122 RepID=A0A401INJ9_APHSA|nr:hypothetical protein AsFPU1_4274 [Aphanothece sacrum FPU1]GBF85925.1 hypothetical protein AsFPU3_2995 [Aphanothece sacrum FPU3]
MISYNVEYQIYTTIIHMKEQSSNVDTQQLLKLLVKYDWLEGTVLGIAKQYLKVMKILQEDNKKFLTLMR